MKSSLLRAALALVAVASAAVTAASDLPFVRERTRPEDIAPGPAVRSIRNASTAVVEVEATWQQSTRLLTNGAALGPWTLLEVIEAGAEALAVFEDVSREAGRLVFVRPGTNGLVTAFGKSLEPAFVVDPSRLYRGHSLDEIFESETDLLGQEILRQPGDPAYEAVAACFAPLRRGALTHTFVGTRENSDKVGFDYGGRTANFDPAVYVPAIRHIRGEGKVWHGLVGGWLPILRFVYPETDDTWSEMLAFAPARMENGNTSIQPVWYRVSRIERNTLRWVRYFDSYHPFPPRRQSSSKAFYRELLDLRSHWERALQPAMQIDIPDDRLADLARHSLVRDLITRDGARPKYGAYDKDYAGAEHEGFPDTFNADAGAMSEWGLHAIAAEFIDNYFTRYVRDDGSILYRGPETGQYGRMLTVVARHARYSGDDTLLLRHRARLDAIARLLESLREKALRLAPEDPAYGIPAGWCEADACLDPEPDRYLQPYLSNAAEMARGFAELGEAWSLAGHRHQQPELQARGEELRATAAAVARDLQASVARSTRPELSPPFLPAIAGAREPFHLAVARDPLDPQMRSYRAFMELLESGLLTRDQVRTIVDYRNAHHDIVLGMPTAYGHATYELAGFLSYGHGYGLLQHDFVREYLLLLRGLMAHQYTRGFWTAPETRPLKAKLPAAPYCTPAQLVVPRLLRAMLVWEDPNTPTLWIAKATPRGWLADGQYVGVQGAPTHHGPISFALRSRLAQNRIDATLQLPDAGLGMPVKLRLRAPEGHRLQGVEREGQAWPDFNAQEETITLPATAAGRVHLEAVYRRQ